MKCQLSGELIYMASLKPIMFNLSDTIIEDIHNIDQVQSTNMGVPILIAATREIAVSVAKAKNVNVGRNTWTITRFHVVIENPLEIPTWLRPAKQQLQQQSRPIRRKKIAINRTKCSIANSKIRFRLAIRPHRRNGAHKSEGRIENARKRKHHGEAELASASACYPGTLAPAAAGQAAGIAGVAGASAF
jgi:hypothetical protein